MGEFASLWVSVLYLFGVGMVLSTFAIWRMRQRVIL
jgi:hypothetical protein